MPFATKDDCVIRINKFDFNKCQIMKYSSHNMGNSIRQMEITAACSRTAVENYYGKSDVMNKWTTQWLSYVGHMSWCIKWSLMYSPSLTCIIDYTISHLVSRCFNNVSGTFTPCMLVVLLHEMTSVLYVFPIELFIILK